MENSIVKIKRKINGSGYPLSSEIGELAINLFDKSFYIINGSSVGITFGTQIDNSSNLIANSDNRICTESSIISYASSMNISGGYSSLLREASNSQILTTFQNNRILFENSIFNNISGLNYSGGTFTNSSGSVMYLHVTYNVILPLVGTNQTFRSGWIQTDGDPFKSKYGICYLSRSNFDQTGGNLDFPDHLNGSFTFPLENNQGFAIYAAHGSLSNVTCSVSSEILKNKISVMKF
jgi:hypothetical protein